jgi:hypothetical protein
MNEPYFFEVPIYHCSKKLHNEAMKKEEQKWASPDNFQRFKWYAWKYNDIIGYLNLYIMGTQFRSDIWLIDKQRINKGIIKKKFILHGKILEKMVPLNRSSTEIFEFIINSLTELNKRDYKKYHFDLSTFKVAGQFVDWIELTKKLNSFAYPELRLKYFESCD